MSRQMSPSPQSRRLPWDQHTTYRPSTGPYGSSSDRRSTGREEERRFAEDMFPQGQRRSPPPPPPPPKDHLWHQRDQEGSFRREPLPRRDFKDIHVPRGSPHWDGGSDAYRQRRGSVEDLQRFNSRGRSSGSPPRFSREPLPLHNSSLSDASQGWRRDDERQGQGRFGDVSPGVTSEELRGSRRERYAENPKASRQRDDVQPFLKRMRRETEGHHHSGSRRDDNKDFGDQSHSSAKADRDFHGDPHGKNGSRTSHFTEHAQAIQDDRKGACREQLDADGRRVVDDRCADSAIPSKEQFRTSNDHSDSRKRHFQDNWRDGSESRRSLPPQERTRFAQFDRQGAATNRTERGGSHAAPGRSGHNVVGNNIKVHKNRTNVQQASRNYQNVPCEEPGSGYRSQRGMSYSNAGEEEEELDWTEDNRHPEQVRPAGPNRHLHRGGPEVEWSRPLVWKESGSKSMTVVTEETLTIKVDMRRPTPLTSSLCYSAERQLSMDLVNVGRQRPGFLPEVSGSTPSSEGVQGGAFTQEIIMLMHAVKELHFKGDGVTLNKRFTELQQGGFAGDETMGLTLNQRFSNNHMNTTQSSDDIPVIFPTLSVVQPAHGPGDLRYDLERRRQKRLEGVTVTIPGGGPPKTAKVRYGGADVTFPDERDYGLDGDVAPKRRGPYRTSAAPMPRSKYRQRVRIHSSY